MAWGLTQSGFSQDAKVMAAVPSGTWGFLAISIVAFVILGSVLEGIPAIVLFGPLLTSRSPSRSACTGALRDGRDLRDGHRAFRAARVGVGYYGACAISKINPGEG